MADNAEGHHHDHQQEKPALDSILQYARAQGIQMHTSVAPYHFPGHGLGIRAAGLLEVCRITSLSSMHTLQLLALIRICATVICLPLMPTS
jgi:hypothetical protein